jgi:hypothetical protein
MKAGMQDQDLGEVEKEDFTGDERNGLQNGPVPDMDTLEIGITKKEMGELFNCMKYSNISFHLQFTFSAHTAYCTGFMSATVSKVKVKLSLRLTN